MYVQRDTAVGEYLVPKSGREETPGNFPVSLTPNSVPLFGLLEVPLCSHVSEVSFSFSQIPNDPQIIQPFACSPEPAPLGQIVISFI